MMIQTIHNSTQSMHQQTIIALCTPQGSGAIGLIRLSGDDAIAIADSLSLLPSGKKLSQQVSHTIHYGWVVDSEQNHIDQVLFLLMKAPKTFTGQDIVEISCHNNQFLIEKIIDRALQCGARLAAKGEFTQRAVMLGKMDLLQAEAMNDLIHAQTAQSLKYNLQQLQGSLSAWIAQVEHAVIEMVAYCEASFEFIDEEMEFASDISLKMEMLIQKIETLIKTYNKQQYIKEGIRIALIGSVNAGKSSLLNCLLDKKRAIVTPIPGTTRDSIEAGMFRDGNFLTFVDTAGIRKTDDAIEQEGIDRSFQEAASADIILLVVDQSKQLSDQEQQAYAEIIEKYFNKIILVRNKIDLAQAVFNMSFTGPCVQISAKENMHAQTVFHTIAKKVDVLKGSDTIICLLNNRQHDLLIKFLEHIKQIMPMLQKSVDYELVSYHLKESLILLSEMTGRTVSEAVLNKVFQSFCVGK